MRILLDARFMDATWAAPSVYARQLIEQLSRLDDQNEYLVVVRPGQKERIPLASNFELVSYRPHPLSTRSLLGFHDLLKDISPDLVHFLSPVVPLFYRGPSLVTVHDLRALSDSEEVRQSSPLSRSARAVVGRLVYPTAFRRALWILCSSNTVRHDLLRMFPHLASKLIVVLPGLPLDANVEVPAGQIEAIRAKCEISAPYLLSSVPGHSNRSLVPLVKAFAGFISESRTGGDGVQLVLSVRNDTSLREVRRAVTACKIGDRVHLLEGLEREEERALLAGARAFVFPARQEGSGLSILEAMAQGVPVVAALDGALPEVCCSASLFTDPDDTVEFSKVLSKVTSDAELRDQLSQRGRAVASRRDWKDTARFVREIYQDLF